MQWYLKVLKNYVGFQGRARRKEYWMFSRQCHHFHCTFHSRVNCLYISSVLTGIYSLAILLPSLAVGARRLHDTGKSGWWQLLSFIPLIGTIILLVFMCLDSDDKENKYGSNPKSSSSF